MTEFSATHVAESVPSGPTPMSFLIHAQLVGGETAYVRTDDWRTALKSWKAKARLDVAVVIDVRSGTVIHTERRKDEEREKN